MAHSPSRYRGGRRGGSSGGCPFALRLVAEPLSLPLIHARQPIPAERSRRTDARIIGNPAVAQGPHVRAILVDPGAYLISSADGPVTGDEDIDVVRHGLEQSQPDEVVADRVGCFQVGKR